MIKVCHISTVHHQADDRIFHKECKSLANNNFETYLVVQHDKNEKRDGVNIVDLPEFNGRFSRFLKGSFIALSKALKTKATIFHFHDPELMHIGLILRLLGKKVIYDVHEDLPKQILYKPWIKYYSIRLLFSKLIYFHEQFSCLFYNRIIAVTDDISKKYSKSKTVKIANYPILGMFDKISKSNIDKGNKFVVLYVGGITRIRGIKEIIKSLELIDDKDVEFWLIGEFQDESYYSECSTLTGWQKVNYFGLLPLDEVYAHMKHANIGMATLYPVKNYLTSLPVKAFEYMACGIPMIMSDFDYWKTLFNDCALFADPYNPEDIAKQIIKLKEDSDLAIQLGKSGQTLTKTEYSWEAEEKKLIQLYQQLC